MTNTEGDAVERPLVSVVIPTLNRRASLTSAIASVRHQAVDFTIEIVVCDNSSTDDTEAIMRGSGYDDISYVRHPSRIPRLDNLMFALRSGHGEFVTMLYDDEIMLQGNLQAKAQALIANPDAAFVTSSVTTRDAVTGRLSPGVAIRPVATTEDRVTYLMKSFSFTTGGLAPVMFRRNTVDSVQLEQRDDPLDDNALLLNLSRLGSVVLLPEGYVTETAGIGEMTGNGLLEQMTSRADPSLQINVPGVWFAWCQYRLRMEHVLRSKELSKRDRWALCASARRNLREGVWKAAYHRAMAGQRPVRHTAALFAEVVTLKPSLLVPPVSSFLRRKVAGVPAPIPAFATAVE